MQHEILTASQPSRLTAAATGLLTVNLDALRRNYKRLADLVAPAATSAVVKADGYGLGAAIVSRTLHEEGCRNFFVAHFSEALALRPDLPADSRVFVLNGLLPGDEILCASLNIIPVLNSLDQFRQWETTARRLKRRLPAVLQFDTGMSRLGFPPEEQDELKAALADAPEIDILFLMSHLASADDEGSEQNASQLEEMRSILKAFPGHELCFANSGAAFLGADYHGMLARPGIALYGGQPATGLPEPMEPVIRLDVAVVQTRTVKAGAKIGYSGTHIAQTEMRLATLAAGYADGLLRSLSSSGAVYYDGIRLPIVGRVSMDSIIVDITTLPADMLTHGSFVEVIGPHQTLEDLAADAGTIAYEILTSLGQRYTRQYIQSAS